MADETEETTEVPETAAEDVAVTAGKADVTPAPEPATVAAAAPAAPNAGPADDHLIESVAESVALALVTRRGVWLLTPREQTYAEAGSDLDSSVVALATAAIPDATVAYVHDWRAAVGAVTTGSVDAALLLRPVTVEQISDWAHARRRMPPKSTYFYPKPRTGMVFRTVED